MTTFTRLSSIALISFAMLTGCGGGGGGGGGGVTTPTGPLSNGDVVIDDLTYDLPPSLAVEFTSFEFNLTAPFSIGPTSFTADFSSGRAETRGNTALYITGLNAWHILYNTTATVTFETPPTTLSFWVRTANAADVSSIEIFDNAAAPIMTITPTSVYQMITVIRMAGETPIGGMVVTNSP